MGDDPRKLVGVHLRSGKLSNLVKSICVASVDLDAESICPIRATVSGVSTNNVISSVNRFFPDRECAQSLSGLNDFSVLEQLSKSIAIVVWYKFLCLFSCLCATGGGEKGCACHHKGIVLSGWELLIHQGFVFDTFVHFPAPPSHLPGINFIPVQLLDVFHPLLLFRTELAIPVDFVDVGVARDRVVLIPPPAAKDCPLCLCLLSRLVHVVKHVESLGSTFKHVKPLRVLFSKRSYQGG